MIHNKKAINVLGVLSGYAKYLSILALVAVLMALAVSSFCTHTPENCADGQELKPGMFCFDNKAWSKCGGKEYDPYTQFCSAAGVLYDKCNGKDEYDPLREFCFGSKVVSKCGNATFDPVTQGCVSGIVKEQCGNNHFDPNNEFCFQNTRIYDKCNGKQFDPTIDVCVAGEAVKPKCGTGNYDIDTQFCYNNYVYKKCNGSEYNPAESFCDGGVKYALCGGQKYDPSRQTCNGASVVDIPKCSSAGYDSATSFCYNNTIYAKCGGKVYDPSIKTCEGTNIVDIVELTVYFNANGGMDGSDPPKTVKANPGKVITIPGQQTISRNGYSFGGWNTSPSGAGTYYNVNDQYIVTGDVTLYVKWIPIRTVTFDGNGATSGDPPEPISVDSGTAIVLPGNRTLAKNGYAFWGWNTSGAETGIRYNADSAYVVTNNVTLFAMWTGFIDSRDGKIYKARVIGDKVWMAENLNYQTPDSSWCAQNDCDKYGRLYAWNVAKNVCPAGWHLSDDAEWNRLVEMAGGSNGAGRTLKTKSGWSSNGTDNYGFSALPGKYRSPDNSFRDLGFGACWWTATENDNNSNFAKYNCISSTDGYVYQSAIDKRYGFSVRCLQN